jgi:superfamily II DNA or RNA helicase
MSRIHFSYLNSSEFKLIADEDVYRTLHEKFKYFAPGYQFHPQYKKRNWDGKVAFFNIKTHTMAIGHFKEAYKYIVDLFHTEAEIKVDQRLKDIFIESGVKDKEIEEFINSLNLHAYNKKIEPRDYQVEAIKQCIKQERIIIESPTSSGKSLVIYSVIRWFLEHHPSPKIILVVPNVSLIKQLFSDFVDYSSHNGFDPNEFVGVVSGNLKDYSKQLTICNWQAVYKNDANFFSKFTHAFIDECHTSKSFEISNIFLKLSNSNVRIGFTGTLPPHETDRLTIKGIFVNKFTPTTTKELMDRGEIAPLKIKAVLNDYKINTKFVDKLFDSNTVPSYNKEVDQIILNVARNEFIIKTANAMKGNILVLFNFVQKQGNFLYDIAKTYKKKVYYIHGSCEADERESIRKILETETDCILIASYGTSSTGISVRNLNGVIFASPSKSLIRVLQSIGRGLRLSENKKECILVDIADRFTQCKHKFHTYQHFLERLKIYEKQQFTVEKIKIDKILTDEEIKAAFDLSKQFKPPKKKSR